MQEVAEELGNDTDNEGCYDDRDPPWPCHRERSCCYTRQHEVDERYSNRVIPSMLGAPDDEIDERCHTYISTNILLAA